VLEQERWRRVRRGLELKLLALSVWSVLPACGALLLYYQGNLRWLIAGIGLAAAPDFAGRCACVAAPIAHRMPILLSVVFQGGAFAVVVALGLGTTIELLLGLGIATVLQLISAGLFLQFLKRAGEHLRSPEVLHRTRQLQTRMALSVLAVPGLGIVALLVAIATLMLTLITWGAGMYLAVPVAAAILGPLALITAVLVVLMYAAYGSAMMQLRQAIRDQEFPVDANPEAG